MIIILSNKSGSDQCVYKVKVRQNRFFPDVRGEKYNILYLSLAAMKGKKKICLIFASEN